MGKQEITVTVREPGATPVDLFTPTSRDIVITGRRNCETLRALIEAGPRGTSSLEHWAVGKRLSHYVMCLRRAGLNIETQDVHAGDGVRYGRYVLRSDVQIKDASDDPDNRAAA